MRQSLWVSFFFCIILFSAQCANASENYWDDFFNKAYLYTYKDKDFLHSEISKRDRQYKTSLEEYNRVLLAEMTGKKLANDVIELSKPDIVKGLATDAYLNAAVGQFLEYLLTNQTVSLNNALLLIKNTEPSFTVTEKYLFWYLFIKAHKELQDNNKIAFENTIYCLWQKIIIPLELKKKRGLYSSSTFTGDLDFHCANILNLVVNKAILEQKMSGLYPLGSVVKNLTTLLPADEGYYREMMNYFDGRTTDSANINYTVAFVRALLLSSSLKNTDLKNYEATFKKTLFFFDVAFSWADTEKGKAAVLTQKSYAITNAWVDMCEGGSKTNTPYFKTELLPISQKIIDNSADAYSTLAKPEGHRENVMLGNGFTFNSTEYATTMKRLWEAAATQVEWQTTFLQNSGELDLKNRAKTNYAQQLVFAHRYFSDHSYRDLIPKTAFFMASQNAVGLAKISIEKAIRNPTPETLPQAFNFQAYATMLNPINLHALILFTRDVHLKIEADVKFLNTFIPLSDLLGESIKGCENGDQYAQYRIKIASLGLTIPVLFRRLPQIVAVLDSSSDQNTVRNAIILANVFNVMASNYGPERANKELLTFCTHNGVNNPKKVLQEVVSTDMYAKVIQSIGNSKKLDPYNYYDLNNEMIGDQYCDLNLFLKNLYYEEQSHLKEPQYFNLKDIDQYVINAATAILKGDN